VRLPSRSARRCLLILGALLALQINLWQLWIAAGDVALGCDAYAHLNNQLRFFDALWDLARSPSLDGMAAALWSDDISPAKWPRFTYLVSSVGTALLGREAGVTVLFTSAAFTAVMLLSLLTIGRRLYDVRVGLLACVLASLLPFTAHYGVRYGLDYPLACMVTASLAALIRADDFKRRRASLVFAGVAALTLLTKLQGVLFLAGPVILVAVRVLRAEGERRRKLVNMALAGGLGAAALAIALAGDLAALPGILLAHTGQSGLRSQSLVMELFGWRSLAFYPVALALGLSPLVLAPALWGLRAGLLLSAVLPPLVAFTFLFSTKWERFMLPAVPLLCVCAASALLRIRRPRLRRAAVATLVAGLAVQMFGAMFVRNPYSRLQEELARAGIKGEDTYPHPPVPNNYRRQLGQLAELAIRRRPSGPVLLGLVEDPAVGPGPAVLLEYHLRRALDGRALRVHQTGLHPWPFFKDRGRFSLVATISERGGAPAKILERVYPRYLDRALMTRAWPRNRFDYRKERHARYFRHAGSLPLLRQARILPDGYHVSLLGIPGRSWR